MNLTTIQGTEKIRPATQADAATISRFQRQMAKETEGITLDAEIVTQGVQSIFEDSNRGVYYVVETEERVIASLLITYEWSEWRNGQVWWIQSVYVEKDFRGQGIFKRLYAYIQSLATSDENIRGIRLYVDNTNIAAQSVYQSIGMNGDHYKVYEWMKS